MSSFVKYKIREVAKDFDMPTKSVMNMVGRTFRPVAVNIQYV